MAFDLWALLAHRAIAETEILNDRAALQFKVAEFRELLRTFRWYGCLGFGGECSEGE